MLCKPSDVLAQLVVNNTQTPQQLVQNVLLGSGVIASNITYTGAQIATGFFNGTNSNIGISSGILMTTGSIYLAVGPNNQTSAGLNLHLPGDSDLSATSGGTTFDAAVLEFDFVPYADTIKFHYVFGSEEYPEYVCCPDNDVFAFYISGPGIVGKKNLALIPTTTTPISINTLNGNCVGTSVCNTSNPCCNSHSNYYIDNTGGTTVQYNGFTEPMTAVSPVQCGQKYHIKIAIADGGDGNIDSGVFLEAGSFTGGSSLHIQTNLMADTLCPNDNVRVFCSDTSTSHIFNWNFDSANVLSGSGSGPYSLSWNTPGMKKIKVSVPGFCESGADSVYIHVNACDVMIPNVFTPNGDNVNDYFVIQNLERHPDSRLIIYDRWGKKVFEDDNYHNEWNGSDLSDGTYYYILDVPNDKTMKGFVTILRKK
ncbi:MAG: choice-of-anchor L domain-containing protein [Bacteroidia bacterium]